MRAPTAPHPLIAGRRSTRGFDPHGTVDPVDLIAMLEAARLAPSAYNALPWRLVPVRRGTASARAVAAALEDYNAWAADAAVLIVGLVEAIAPDGTRRETADHDLGGAVALLSLEASSRGIGLCQLAGFDTDAVREALTVPPMLRVRVVVAIGPAGPPAPPPPGVTVGRKPLSTLITAGRPQALHEGEFE